MPKEETEQITGMMMIHSMLNKILNKMKMTKDQTHLNKRNINPQKIRKR